MNKKKIIIGTVITAAVGGTIWYFVSRKKNAAQPGNATNTYLPPNETIVATPTPAPVIVAPTPIFSPEIVPIRREFIPNSPATLPWQSPITNQTPILVRKPLVDVPVVGKNTFNPSYKPNPVLKTPAPTTRIYPTNYPVSPSQVILNRQPTKTVGFSRSSEQSFQNNTRTSLRGFDLLT